MTSGDEWRPTGKIDPSGIRSRTVPRPPPGVVAGLAALGDATGIVSDVLDELGVAGVVGASRLRPTLPGSVLVGPALTVRNVARAGSAHEAARAQANGMAEFEAHNLAVPGDVVVIQGVAGVSNMGGISAQTGRRQGEAGAVVDGGIRDLGHSRRVGYPLWAAETTPVTGKWRVRTVEINGPIEVAGVAVEPGDIVLADDSGVCFVPRDLATEVLRRARERASAEAAKCRALDEDVPVWALPQA